MGWRLQAAILIVMCFACPTIAGAQSITLTERESAALRMPFGDCSSTSIAQISSVLQPARAALTKATRKLALSQFADPALAVNPGTVANNGVALEVSRDGSTTGRAQLARHLDSTTLSLTLKGPIKNDSGDVFSDLGLSEGASYAVGLSHTFWSKNTAAVDALSRLSGALVTACPALLAVVRDDTDALALALYGATSLSLDRGRFAGVLANRVLDAPTLQGLADHAVRSGILTVSRAFTAGGHFGKSRETFKFVTEQNLTTQSAVHEGEEFSFGAGYSRSHTLERDGVRYVWPQLSAGIGFRKETVFNAGPVRQVCTAFGASATQCRNVATQEPATEHSKELVIDVRHWAYGDKVAANLNLVRDFESEANRAELRLSYIQLKKSDLGDGAPRYFIDNDALSVGARIGTRWGGKEAQQKDGAYFMVYFAATLGAFDF